MAAPPAKKGPRATKTRIGISAAVRLKEALALLVKQRNTSNALGLTATQLCRLAGVSRNTLYRYHTQVLKALRTHQSRGRSHINSTITNTERLENIYDIEKLVALVDHYYTAYREASVLLERRDRELADLRRVFQEKPTLLKS